MLLESEVYIGPISFPGPGNEVVLGIMYSRT